MSTTLPKVGTILEHDGRYAVVIGIAGTYNRGVMPVRACDRFAVAGNRTNGRIDGVLVQHVDNGNVSTITRAQIKLCGIVESTLDEVMLYD